jgi:Mn-dependent DtxR family transcriptional regulator
VPITVVVVRPLTRTQARKQRRNAEGRLTSAIPAHALVDLVREVAVEAARSYSKDVRAPWEVEKGQWNLARQAWLDKRVSVPEAKNVLRTLKKHLGIPKLTWEKLLLVIFKGDADPYRALVARGMSSTPPISVESAIWALNPVAVRCSVLTFPTIAAYEAARITLIKRSRGAERQLLKRYLPEGVDIAKVCGGWRQAQTLAGLIPTEEMVVQIRRRGTPSGQLQLLHYARYGILGFRSDLNDLAESLNTRATQTRGKLWDKSLAEAAELIESLGLPAPPPYGAPTPKGWTEIPIDLDLDIKESRATRAEALAALGRCHDWLEGIATLTEHGYRAYYTYHPEEPQIRDLLAHGSFADLQRALAGLGAGITDAAERRKSAQAKMVAQEEASQKQTQRNPTLQDVGRAKQNEADRQRILVLLKQHGRLSKSAIVERLATTSDATKAMLRELRETDLICATEHKLHSKYQQYELTAEGRSEAERTNISARGAGTPQRPAEPVKRSQSIAREEMILDLLGGRDTASVAEIAERFGWKREITNERVRRLRKEGLIEATVEPLASMHQRYRIAKGRRRRAAA